MRYAKLNKEQKVEKLKMNLHGDGIFLFENNTSGDLMLPKPAKGGRARVGKGQRFQGDSYFLSMVKNNQLKLVSVVIAPPARDDYKIKEEGKEMLNEQKLILDQPETFTVDGKVEQVVKKDKKKLNESKPEVKQPLKGKRDVLIAEEPIGEIEIINE